MLVHCLEDIIDVFYLARASPKCGRSGTAVPLLPHAVPLFVYTVPLLPGTESEMC